MRGRLRLLERRYVRLGTLSFFVSLLLLLYTNGGVKISPPGVVVTFEGGLGNQLFRYACTYSLAKTRQIPIYLYLPENTYHTPEAGCFNYSSCRQFALDNFNVSFDNTLRSSRTYSYSDVEYFDDEDLIFQRMSHNKLLIHNDYCQSETFFQKHKEDILSMFTPRWDKISVNLQRWMEKLNSSAIVPVALHVRRGDYMKTGWWTPITYFEKAMVKMENMLRSEGHLASGRKLVFYIFTDSVDMVKKELKTQNFTVEYVSKTGLSSTEEFFLMTKCWHAIISNSTFSWWAAYLIKNPDKIIIAPEILKKFYKHYPTDEKRQFKVMEFNYLFYPPQWVVLNVEDSEGS